MRRRRYPQRRRADIALLAVVLVVGGGAEASAQSPSTDPNAARQSTRALLFDSAQDPDGTPASQVRPPLPGPEEAVDRDGDGIPTLVDFCPDSPPGTRVDDTGCARPPQPWWMWAGGAVGLFGAFRIGWVPFARWQRRKRLRESRMERAEMMDDAPGPFHAPGAPIPWSAPPLPEHVPGQQGASDADLLSPPQLPSPNAGGKSSPPPFEPHLPEPQQVHPSQPTPPPGVGRVGFPAAAPAPPPGPPPSQASAWGSDIRGMPGQAVPPPPSEPLFQSSPANPAGQHHWHDQPLHYEEPAPAPAVALLVRHPLLTAAVVLLAVVFGGVAWMTQGRSPRPPGPSRDITPVRVPTVVALGDDSVRASGQTTRIPAALRMVDGDAQRGRVGQTLPTAVAVQVEDEDGQPIPGVAVMFEATVGGGVVTPIATQTDSTGVARSVWTLGEQVVKQYVVARVAGSQAGVAFEADATPGLAARLALVRGDSQTATPGEMLTDPVVVRVEAEEGQPLEGVRVLFATDGGGSVNPVEGVSDTLGQVSTVWTLGMTGDSTVLRVEVADAPGIAATAVARASFPTLPARAGVVAGGSHSCALSANGNLACWGGNQSGQLGAGSGRAPRPRAVAPGQRFSEVSAGLAYSCGVGSTGVAYCWGDNANAQLGNGTRTQQATPQAVAADVRFRSVTAGNGHTCAISREGSVFCWGSNSYGQLGDGTRSDRDRPTRTLGPSTYQTVAVGWFHTCTLTPDGRASCWGRNIFGQLGDGTTTDHPDPAPVDGPIRYRSLSAGGAHTCGLGTDQVIYCWGQNNHGQLGDGGNAPRALPTPVSGGPWRSIATGTLHTCALDTSGAAFCWGRNTYGQLGDGTATDQSIPRPVQGGLVFATIQASAGHTCGATAAGDQYCWGYNVEGQLGDGTRGDRRTPTRVGGPE